jgi:putative phosphoesterase
MKILFVSDLHANKEAQDALPDDYDALICAGDLVDYGPDPKAAISFIRKSAKTAVTGNHDKAAAFGIDCGCGETMKEISKATRAHLELDEEEKAYLAGLPMEAHLEIGGIKIYVIHATPKDLYRYIAPDITDEDLTDMFADKNADIILWGHTHLPWIRNVGNFTVLNPGSLGQPRDGNPDASFAVWEDGRLRIIRKSYDREITADKIRSGPLTKNQRRRLVRILFTGKT